MKNRPIDPYAAQDIQAQVDKVLRGLGNPEPPIDLCAVRELLNLDLQYNEEFGTTRVSLSHAQLEHERDGVAPARVLAAVGRGDVEPPLEVPGLGTPP
jgi:hypothetical protein